MYITTTAVTLSFTSSRVLDGRERTTLPEYMEPAALATKILWLCLMTPRLEILTSLTLSDVQGSTDFCSQQSCGKKKKLRKIYNALE